MNDILELPGVTILNREETEHDIRFTVEVEVSRVVCSHCGSIENANRFGKKAQITMDMPIRAKRVGLDIQRKRFRCKDCGRTFMQPLYFVDERRQATIRLIAYVRQESLRRTFTSIARDVGVTEATIRAIFKDHTEELEHSIHFETPEWLGLDELKLDGTMRGIMTNVKERTVLDLLAKRDIPTIENSLRRLEDKKKVQLVTMDMWAAYKNCVRRMLPHAEIIVDKFHVLKPASFAMDKVRKQIRLELTDSQRRTLMHDRFILLRRRFELKPHEILIRETWFGAFPRLAKAYELKEQFYDIYEAADQKEAEERYDAWRAAVPKDLEPAYHDVITYMLNWRAEIFAYFTHGRATNAYTEAVNGLAKLIARNGRGYSFQAVRAKVLYGNGLKMWDKPKYDKTRTKGGDPASQIMGYAARIEIESYVGRPHYMTLGNEISTLIQHLKDGIL
jgi:transposase